MSDFTVSIDADGFVAGQAARHLETSGGQIYWGPTIVGTGHSEGCVKPGCPAVSPVAVALRELAGQVRAGGGVRVQLARLERAHLYEMSECLRRSWLRSMRENDPAEVSSLLESLLTEWDRQGRVRGDEGQRYGVISEPSRRRAERAAAAEAREREARVRELDRRSMLVPAGDEG